MSPCAPTLIFLAGTSAFLSRTRGKSKAELSWFLFTRGIWLAIFEVTMTTGPSGCSTSISCTTGPASSGRSAGRRRAVYCRFTCTAARSPLFGGLPIGLHNMLDGLSHTDVRLPQVIWTILHSPGDAPIFDDFTFGTGYCVVPWAGVMAAGYGFGTILRFDGPTRRTCLFA